VDSSAPNTISASREHVGCYTKESCRRSKESRESIIADLKRDKKAGRNSSRSVVTGQLIGHAIFVPARRALNECFFCYRDMWTSQDLIDQVIEATGKLPIYACTQCAKEMMERQRALTERKLAEAQR
jgi:hypothetical protein